MLKGGSVEELVRSRPYPSRLPRSRTPTGSLRRRSDPPAAGISACSRSAAEILSGVKQKASAWVWTTGPLAPDPSELLASNRTKSLLEALAKTFDTVIIDRPPCCR